MKRYTAVFVFLLVVMPFEKSYSGLCSLDPDLMLFVCKDGKRYKIDAEITEVKIKPKEKPNLGTAPGHASDELKEAEEGSQTKE